MLNEEGIFNKCFTKLLFSFFTKLFLPNFVSHKNNIPWTTLWKMLLKEEIKNYSFITIVIFNNR